MINIEKVNIVPFPGKYIPAKIVNPPLDSKDSDVQTILNILSVHPSSEKNSFNIILNAMPATFPTYDSNKVIPGFAPIKNKSSPFSNFVFEAFRSGSRSAILPCNKILKNKYDKKDWIIAEENNYIYIPSNDLNDYTDLIRLKGCGMYLNNSNINFPGFTLREAKSCHYHGNDKIYEIRGCSFENTSLTEIYITNLLINNSKQLNIQIGNIPLGIWKYNNIESDETPKIQKNVIILKTFGDKRLETNLLNGIEQILYHIDNENIINAVNIIKDLYKKFNIFELGDKIKTFSKISKIPNNLLTLNEKLYNDFKKKANYLYVLNDYEKLISNGIVPNKDLIQNLKKINFTLNKKIFNFGNLAELFAQIGYECGRVLSVIHRSGCLWGTYIDHSENECHCNSHPDNFIILNLSDAKKFKQILAAVDFDMAFEARCAVNIWTQKKDPSMVYDNQYAEFESLIKDICGLGASFPGISTAIQYRKQPEGELSIILNALRDIAVWEYFNSYDNPILERPFKIDEYYEIINIALNYTKNIYS